MKRIMIALIAGLVMVTSPAQEKSAEELVAGKVQADMTYRQLMEIMVEASGMMHEGIIRELNLVRQ